MAHEPENPYQSPRYSRASLLVEQADDELGALIGEYRVGRVVKWASLMLLTVTTGICLLVTIQTFMSHYDSIRTPLGAFGFMLVIESGAGVFASAALRTRFAIFKSGIVSTNAMKTTRFRFGEVSEMYVNKDPIANLGKAISPLKPHLVIAVGSPVQKRKYLCPYLISDLGLFETAINAWMEAQGAQDIPGENRR